MIMTPLDPGTALVSQGSTALLTGSKPKSKPMMKVVENTNNVGSKRKLASVRREQRIPAPVVIEPSASHLGLQTPNRSQPARPNLERSRTRSTVSTSTSDEEIEFRQRFKKIKRTVTGHIAAAEQQPPTLVQKNHKGSNAAVRRRVNPQRVFEKPIVSRKFAQLSPSPHSIQQSQPVCSNPQLHEYELDFLAKAKRVEDMCPEFATYQDRLRAVGAQKYSPRAVESLTVEEWNTYGVPHGLAMFFHSCTFEQRQCGSKSLEQHARDREDLLDEVFATHQEYAAYRHDTQVRLDIQHYFVEQIARLELKHWIELDILHPIGKLLATQAKIKAAATT